MTYPISYSLALYIKIEPLLNECYGIRRDHLSDIITNSVDFKKLDEFAKHEYPNSKHIDFITCALKTIKSLTIYVTKEYEEDRLIQLCELYNISLDSQEYQILHFVYLLSRQYKPKELTEAEAAEYSFWEYAVGVRPEMLKLYIALHGGETKFHKSCRVAVGDSKPIKIDQMIPWLQMELSNYLDKYLGVQDVKEAEKELMTVYGKQVGAKMNKDVAQYIWGTYHVLQKTKTLASGKPKSVTNKQSKFIMQYLTLLGIINPAETDAGTIRSKLNYFLKTYDNIDELLQNIHYKTSPNNVGGMRYY